MKRDMYVTWILTVATALALFGDATMYAVLPSQYALVGVSALSVGWLLSINRLVRPPLNVLAGWMSEHLGPRVPFITGMVVGAISTAGYGLVEGFWPLMALRALWGVAWALLVVAAYAMILEVSTESTRGRLTGLYANFSFFGGALGPVLGGVLLDSYGVRAAMLVLAACSALGCALALALPRTEPAASQRTKAAATEAVPLSVRWRAFTKMLRGVDGRLWLIGALIFGHRFFFAGIFYATFGRYLQTVFGDEFRLGALAVGVASLTGTLMFVRNVITVAVGPGLGYLSDRLRDRPTVLMLGQAVAVGGLLAFAIGGSIWAIALGVFLAAVAYGIIPPLLVAWMGDLAGDRNRGQFVGAYQTMGDIGSGLAPALAYPLLEVLGMRTLYGLSAACMAVTIPLILRARHRQAAEAACATAPGAETERIA